MTHDAHVPQCSVARRDAGQQITVCAYYAIMAVCEVTVKHCDAVKFSWPESRPRAHDDDGHESPSGSVVGLTLG